MGAETILRYKLHLKSGDWAQYLRAPKLVETALCDVDVIPAKPKCSIENAIMSTVSLAEKWKRGDMSAAAQLAGIYSRPETKCTIQRMYESTSIPRQKNIKPKRVEAVLPQPTKINPENVHVLLNMANVKKDSFMPYCAPHGFTHDTLSRLAAAVGTDMMILPKRGRNFNSLYELSGEWPLVVFGPTASLTSVYHELVHHVVFVKHGRLKCIASIMRHAEVVAECAGAVSADMMHGLPGREMLAAAEYIRRHMDEPMLNYVDEICLYAGILVAAARRVFHEPH